MATPGRIVYINGSPYYDNPYPYQMRPSSSLAAFIQFLHKPHSVPLVCIFFLFITWLVIRLHHAADRAPDFEWSSEDDLKANLVRFSSGIASQIAKDSRGWLLHPVSLAPSSGISGGAVSCASVSVGEIRPGRLRGNHRHHDRNETLLFWGATTKFRLENKKVGEKGYAQVIVGGDEIAIAASPSGSAHALVNIDHIRSTFFIRCQDNVTDQHNSSSTDVNVWKDL
ncbi:uncharacterized protein LOC129305582 [Prosopis cineraria]|uniref:uncharacterized protein LOC129305582 n=1 Tax=Prosopis cineraria TaxID=364024 RepID=UPI00240FC5B8|nr:uncharacterized protein LOC129305582 [Prosopis cineraria]